MSNKKINVEFKYLQVDDNLRKNFHFELFAAYLDQHDTTSSKRTICLIPIAEIENLDKKIVVTPIDFLGRPQEYSLELFHESKTASLTTHEYDDLKGKLKDSINPFAYYSLLDWGSKNQPEYLVNEIQSSAFSFLSSEKCGSISSLKLAYVSFSPDSVKEINPENAVFELLKNKSQLKVLQAEYMELDKQSKMLVAQNAKDVEAIATWKNRASLALVFAFILGVIIVAR